MRRSLLTIMVVWSMAAGTAAAAGPPRLQDAGTAVAVASDGRYVLAEQADGGARVLDTNRPGPARIVSVPRGCFASSISGNSVLVSCYDGWPGAGYVYDLGTGAMRALPPAPLQPNALNVQNARIGRRWVEARVYDLHDGLSEYLDLAAGRWRAILPGARSVIDLDSARLVRPLCAPLRRLPLGRHLAFTAGGIAYRSPYAAGLTNQHPRRLVLWRCHRARPTLLSRCPLRCLTPHLARDVVAWYDERLGPRIQARRLSRGTTYSWSIPGLSDPAVTPGRVWVAAGGRLLTARLP